MIGKTHHRPTLQGTGTPEDPMHVLMVQPQGEGKPVPEWLVTGSAIVISVVVSYFLQKYLSKRFG